jgi:hypothetical protein
MFYDAIKSGWQQGKVRVGLPGRRSRELELVDDRHASIEAEGLLGLKAKFLSRPERMKLVHLVKSEFGHHERELPFATIRHWMAESKAVLLTGKCGVGKTCLLSVALPDAVFINGRTADPSKPHWFWHQITEDPSRPLVVDEPHALSPLVLMELLKIVREQGRGFVVIDQAESGERFEFLSRAMTNTPVGIVPGPESNFLWVKLNSFRGEVALAKWTGKSVG